MFDDRVAVIHVAGVCLIKMQANASLSVAGAQAHGNTFPNPQAKGLSALPLSISRFISVKLRASPCLRGNVFPPPLSVSQCP